MAENPGQFKSGPDERRGTSGRGPSGRQKALNLVDTICGDEKNLATLKAAMQEEFDRDPMKFFTDIVVPLVPKQANATLSDVGYSTMTPAEAVAQMDQATIGGIDAPD